LVGGQTVQFIIEQGFDNRDKGVAVVITKRREAVALKTELQEFGQGLFLQSTPLPQIFRWNVTVGRRFVEGFAGFTQRGIDGDDRFPRNNLKPVFIQPGHCGCEILIFSGRL
jgi:hypothetical protein